jgi:hypothetical protein
MNVFKKHPFGASIGCLAGAYLVFFLVIYLCRGAFPNPGFRDVGYDPTKLALLSQANSGSGLTADWSQSSGSYSNEAIVLPGQASLTSPQIVHQGIKYVSFTLSEKIPSESLVLTGYVPSAKSGDPDAAVQQASAHYLGQSEGYDYELRFSYDRDDISRVALAYNGSSPANIYISQFAYYYFAY